MKTRSLRPQVPIVLEAAAIEMRCTIIPVVLCTVSTNEASLALHFDLN